MKCMHLFGRLVWFVFRFLFWVSEYVRGMKEVCVCVCVGGEGETYEEIFHHNAWLLKQWLPGRLVTG